MQSRAIKHVSLILFFALLLPIVGGELLQVYLPYKFIDLAMHSLFESIGGFIAISLSAFLYYRSIATPQLYRKYIWVIMALSTMGTFDLFHAALSPGNNFVWFHSIAAFSGGFFFSLIWLSRIQKLFISKFFVQVTILITLSICLYSIISPQNIPIMLSQDGTFSPAAKILNLGGGILFIISTAFFLSEYKDNKHDQELLFVGHTLLFGIAGLLFNASILFDAGWWFWHILRLTAYMFAQYFIINVFLYEVRAHKQAQIELKRSNINLHEKVAIALNKQQAQQNIDAKYARMNSLSAMISLLCNQWRKPLTSMKVRLNKTLEKDQNSQVLLDINKDIQGMERLIEEFSKLHQRAKNEDMQSLRDALEAAIEIISPLLEKNSIDIKTTYHCLSRLKYYNNSLTEVFLYLFQYLSQKPINPKVLNAKIELNISERINTHQTISIIENFSISNEDELFNQLIDNSNPISLAKELLKTECNARLLIQNTMTGSKFIIDLGDLPSN